jgi:hypothetical protein
MKVFIVISLSLFPILVSFASDKTVSDTNIAVLQANQSFGSNSNPVVRTLYRWDISSITKDIEPNSSSDGKAIYAPSAVACASLAIMVNQEKSRIAHNEIIQNELNRKGLGQNKKQRLLNELKYINDYEYSITCESASKNLAQLTDITGQVARQLRDHIIESNEKYPSKPSKFDPDKLLALPE